MSDTANGDKSCEEYLFEAERLAKTKLGLKIELTISDDDITPMLRACVRVLLAKNGLTNLAHVADDMRLQVSHGGVYSDIVSPLRFTNKL